MTKLHVDEKIRAAWDTMEILIEWTSRYDTKSAVVLTLTTAMLGVLAGFSPGTWNVWVVLGWGGGAILVGASALCAILGNFPRTKGPEDSLVFFGAIAKGEAVEYAAAVKKRSKEDLLEDLLAQCHVNGVIVAKKFKWLRRSYVLLLLSLAPWVVNVMAFAGG